MNPEEIKLETVISNDEAEHNYGHIKSFVHRKGHFSEAQRRAYETLMPKYGLTYQKELKNLEDWAEVFGNNNPIVLEIGCGMGETTAKIALQNPHINYVGVEVFTSGVGALLKRIDEHQLTNLRVIQHDAVEIVRDMVAPDTLSGVHVFFPDPWHKARHHKRRLIQPPFVHELAKRLRSDGYIHCATDWENYAEQMLSVLSSESLLINYTKENTFIPRPESRPLTKYENRGNRLGHGVWDILFLKNTI
ncbi:tRNA (guanosine(46)-N7)-methyltransferase TrmB [Hydromonas duriensis]|uniref:tRNA (guanine-N(7)-)-methyltransferase n=1 Tax=Hydromonas duriensis TaxID=1527608 RepID=A0A4R6YBM9_9BURK|nr:tRNA (guanosine(46)-N7)-methyltransferase TrmB [Hydromonas duriensis]TDR32994.1 tRNA (guanine-N(7)-)-methyltransferase [Hydromonas duriensis]